MGEQTEVSIQPIDGETIEISGKQAIGIVAFSLYWTWFFTIMFSGTFVLPLPPTFHIEPVFRFSTLVAMTVSFLALTTIGKRLFSKRGLVAMLACAAACSPWVCGFTALSAEGFSPPVAILIWALFGVAAALLFYCTALFMVTLKPRSTVLALGVAVTVAAAFYFLLRFIEGSAIWFVIALLPIVSAICIWLSGVPADVERFKSGLSDYGLARCLTSSIRVQPAQPFYGIVFSLVMGVGISINVLQVGGFPISTAVAFCLAGPAVFAIALAPHKIDTEVIQWFLLPVSVAGLSFLLIEEAQVALVCCAALAFCYSFFDLTHTLSLVELMREQDDAIPYIFAAGKFWFFLGTSIGWGLSAALLSVGYYTTVFNVSILLVVTCIAFVIAYLGRPSVRMREEEIEAPAEDSGMGWDDVCAEIAQERGLSPRQTEVFLLLSKGRNAPYIEEELVVSYHTVKAHIYRIYQKLDVHTHQELIDYVEARVADKK